MWWQGGAWLGGMHGCGGGMCGCGRVCVVVGGMHGCRGCAWLWGACMVAGGHV